MGHHAHPHKRPWIEIDEIVTATLADIIGARDRSRCERR